VVKKKSLAQDQLSLMRFYQYQQAINLFGLNLRGLNFFWLNFFSLVKSQLAFSKLFLACFFLICLSQKSFAFSSGSPKSTNSSTVLQADEIDGDSANKLLTAHGNVEITKDSSILYADKVTYNQGSKIIYASGDVKIKNLEVGNMFASKAEVKDDFSSGKFFDNTIVFKDGSYLKSPNTEKENINKTTLYKATFSFCPNPEIAGDNQKAGQEADLGIIKTSSTIIDREDGVMRSKHNIVKIYNVPVMYIPYISVALPSKKRKSGFLTPSYIRTTNFGFGVKIPYYFNIAPNIDLTTTPQISLTNNQVILSNNFRHLTTYGRYNINLDVANNELRQSQIRTAALDNNTSGLARQQDKDIRWNLSGAGLFDFNKNLGADFKINTASDINYYRDYNFNFLAYAQSHGNLDYIKKRDYYSIRAVKFQELENSRLSDEEQIVVPEINTYSESDKSLLFKEKYALTTNLSTINRVSGLQYRRATFVPEVKIPFNLKGNLFDINAKFQGDLYWLENNSKDLAQDKNYSSTASNYKPEVSLSWRLPLIQKAKRNTLIFEPIASLVSSSYKRKNLKTVNEDSNNSELSISNIFVADRISGFDRNEAGERFNYGFKSSAFNKLGEFGLIMGQTFRISSATQDVPISGFADNNRSNIVGQAIYKAAKYFNITYAFQLNEHNYRNDINQITSSLTFDKFSIGGNYLMLRRNQQNLQKIEQVSLNSTINFYDNWSLQFNLNRDMELKRTISRGVTILRDGCCTVFGFAITETNPGSLVKPQRSFTLNLTFKNL
jgi:LPS-assembly protein